MRYNITTENFKTFEKFKENVMQPRSYFIPFSSLEELEGTDIRNERYSSKMVECLSGEWDFIYYKSCLNIPNEFDTDSVDFDKIAVPSTWQHTGYEKPYYVNTRYQFKPNPPEIPNDCPVGIYRKIFNIDDCKQNFYLCFLGVAGALDLFVNGKYVGYSEGSHNTAQFELNEFVVEGENEIVVVNHKWSNGTYLECQDMFR
jgi:beta-galactosidase